MNRQILLLIFCITNFYGCASNYPAGFWQNHSQEYVPWEKGHIKRTFTNSDAIRIREFKQKYTVGTIVTDCDPYISLPDQPCKLLVLRSNDDIYWAAADEELADSARSGDFNTVKRSLKSGVTSSAKDYALLLTSFAANKKNSIKIAKTLLAYGANIEATYLKTGKTPLIIATSKRASSFVEMLIDNNASLEAKTVSGNSAYDIATRKEYTEIIKLFSNYADKLTY